jgi:hypothetical protein
MKIGFNKLALAATLLVFAAPSYAAGTIIATAILVGASATTIAVVGFAINMVISAVITKAFFTPNQPSGGDFGGGLSGSSPNPGNRQQVPPATDNKLPLVYGQAYLGGTIIDLSISENNQELYYVIAIAEVTNNGSDTLTFGDVYYGGKRCVFEAGTPNVTSLVDESTGISDTSVKDKLQIYLYRNGSNSQVNSSSSAISVMRTDGLTYIWDNSKLMTRTAFAIVHLSYDANAGLTGIAQTKFQLTNSRFTPGNCFLDYLTNTVYGAAIPISQIDTASLTALDAYCAGSFAYTNSSGSPATQARFRFDGVVNPDRSIMDNLQDMASSCDCLLKYNEIQGKWGVITQSPTYTIAMALNDSNMVSSIVITPLDIAGSYNVIECKFPDNSNQDAFNSSTFDLAQLNPSLLYPNEPVNKQSVTLPLVNNNVRAQYIATRMLKASREDLQVQVTINFQGIQLEAGDIVTVTNANYGWVAKQFRVMKVTEDFESNGAVTAKLILTEFTPSIYDDVAITAFQPSPNTGIPNPLVFGSVPPPSVGASYPSNSVPFFTVNVTGSAAGIIQYAEVWYSAFQTPTSSQRIFAGTTEIQSNGTPYNPGATLPAISISTIPAGNWYFFSRMVNSLGTSAFSLASTVFNWKPTTFQYTERYIAVAYANNATGTSGFSLSPTNKLYYGLQNTASQTGSTNPADYFWYLADPSFDTNKFLCFSNRQSRRFSFATGFANYAAGTGAFVPTQALVFDPRIWSALPNGSNIIDLDFATGQVLQTGTTTVGTGEIEVTNNPDGKVIASLKQYLDFGSGIYQKTASVATLTIDIYGRVVGFTEPDVFYMTIQSFVATSNQTVFNVTRGAGYISGQCLVFQNGILQPTASYADTGGTTGTVTFTTGRTAGVQITIVSFKSSNTTTGVYPSFSRNSATLTGASSYTPSGYTLSSGYELLFINGSLLTEQDYDIVGNNVTNFPSLATGELNVIQWTPNNLTTPNGDPVNIIVNTVIGQVSYPFSFAPGGFNLYENGVLLIQGSDYTTTTGGYTLTNSPTTNTSLLLQQTFARTGAV